MKITVVPNIIIIAATPWTARCAAQSIESLASFSSEDPECLELAIKVAQWTIENMQGRDGHFYYRIYPWGKAKTPMLHWAQATMYKALALLLDQLAVETNSRMRKGKAASQIVAA